MTSCEVGRDIGVGREQIEFRNWQALPDLSKMLRQPETRKQKKRMSVDRTRARQCELVLFQL